MPTRIYTITPRAHDADKPLVRRLVRAANPAQALRHVANDFTVDVASQDDLEHLLTKGVKVELAKADDKGDAP